MLAGQIIGLPEESQSDLLLENPVSELNVEEDEDQERIVYRASFDELSDAHLQYDTIVWVLISLPMILAWGIGVLMLLYLPIRRYILKKDISSRKLYVTSDEIVYKVTRPWFLPLLGVTKFEKHIRLNLVIDLIIEQGCLQSAYGIHTLRVESVGYGKMTPVDELQVQGVSNPGILKKVILIEASRSICEGAISHKGSFYASDEEHTPRKAMGTVTEIPTFCNSPGTKGITTPLRAVSESRVVVSGDVLHKLDEVKKSVQRIESLIGATQFSEGS